MQTVCPDSPIVSGRNCKVPDVYDSFVLLSLDPTVSVLTELYTEPLPVQVAPTDYVIATDKELLGIAQWSCI